MYKIDRALTSAVGLLYVPYLVNDQSKKSKNKQPPDGPWSATVLTETMDLCFMTCRLQCVDYSTRGHSNGKATSDSRWCRSCMIRAGYSCAFQKLPYRVVSPSSRWSVLESEV